MTADVVALDCVSKVFQARTGIMGRTRAVRAVDGVSLSIRASEALGLVGESGSGKSTVARLMVGLMEPTAGRVLVGGRDLAAFTDSEVRRARRHLQIVFQDPVGALDPRQTAFDALNEVLRVHRSADGENGGDRVERLLDMVGLRSEDAHRFPHELSGGQCQRLGIARALAVSPAAIIADEPVSQLDVSTQAQILLLLDQLRASLGLTLLLIAHDLSVVRQVVERVAVLFAGLIVEEAPVSDLFSNPLHPYSRALLDAVPRPGRRAGPDTLTSPGSTRARSGPGCAFASRCCEKQIDCLSIRPDLKLVEGGRRSARCILA